MRITNSMMVSSFMNRLNTNLTKMSDIQGQLATGKKHAHLSDDPIAVIFSRQARYKLNRLEQYQQNVEVSNNWLKQAETGILELNELMKSAYEACVDAATDVKSGSDKKNSSEYIGQLRDQLLDSLNSAFGTKYVFGGYNTTGHTATETTNKNQAPFSLQTVWLNAGGKVVDASDPLAVEEAQHVFFNGLDLQDENNFTGGPPSAVDQLRQDVLTLDVGPGIEMAVTVNGIDIILFGEDADGKPKNMFTLLDSLYQTVKSGAGADEINAHISDLQEAQSHLLAITAEIGGRTNRLEILSSRYEQDGINYTQMLSDAEDADYSEVIMNYKMAEAVYKAALSAGAYIIQPTLMDFLR